VLLGLGSAVVQAPETVEAHGSGQRIVALTLVEFGRCLPTKLRLLKPIERRKVMALAQTRRIDAVLVTELSRWGRSTTDLLATLKELEARRVSVIALSGMAFDLATPHGRMIATVLAGIAEFERELIQERIRSGIAAAKARGKRLGRQPGQRPKSDRLTPKVLALIGQGRSYRLIGREVVLSKNTVAQIAKRNRDNSFTPIV
jgi:putative DNA-invertase from lambdoid prophage Rac